MAEEATNLPELNGDRIRRAYCDQTQGTSVECYVCVGIKSEAPVDGMHQLFLMVTNHNTKMDTLITGLIETEHLLIRFDKLFIKLHSHKFYFVKNSPNQSTLNTLKL